MGAKVFVPCTDEEIEALGRRGTPLVPYHPDRPCWHAERGAVPRSTSNDAFVSRRRLARGSLPLHHRR